MSFNLMFRRKESRNLQNQTLEDASSVNKLMWALKELNTK